MNKSGEPVTEMAEKCADNSISVVHFGNKNNGTGGIASVIRQHLTRSIPNFELSAVTTYDQDGSSLITKNVPVLSALVRVFSLNAGTIVHVHLSQRGSLLREGMIIAAAKLKGSPVVATIHGSSLSNPSRTTARALKFILSRTDLVHGFADSYREKLSLPKARWKFLPNDVAVPETIRPAGERDNVVVFAGQVGHRKGIDLLLGAWSLMDSRGWKLVVAGPIAPEERADLFAQPWPDGSEYIGPLSHEDLLGVLARSRVLVQPSRAEAFPMAVCEALANGCAVVGTRVGGLGELLDASKQISVDGSIESLNTHLSQLLGDESALTIRSSSGRAHAESHLSGSVVTTEWISVYRGLAHPNSESQIDLAKKQLP